MQHYHHDDPYEREPLEPGHPQPHRPAPSDLRDDYSTPGTPSPYYDSSPQPPQPSRHQEPFHRAQDPEYSHSGSPYDNYHHEAYRSDGVAPPPPRHGDNSWSRDPSNVDENMEYTQHAAQSQPQRGQQINTVTPGADNFSGAAAGGMASIAYGLADRNARESGMQAVHGGGQVPPPPSRTNPNPFSSGSSPYSAPQPYDGLGGGSAGSRSYTSMRNPYDDHYGEDPYRGYSSSVRNDDHLGVVNPNEIEDDGDDGLHYHPKPSQRNSMLSSSNSDRGVKPGMAAGVAAAGSGLAASHLGQSRGGNDFDLSTGQEKSRAWQSQREAKKKRKRWIIIVVVLFVIGGAIIGGVVGGLVTNSKKGGKSGGGNSSSNSSDGQSADEDRNENGDLGVDSKEIRDLMDNSRLHKVFPGMDYTPINTQYPECYHNPPSQNNVTRDIAVLSQLTNKIRLYGTDCNQTQMVIHAINRLDLQDDVKIWMGVWQDGNETTNARQLEQMWDVLDQYGDEPFEGLIVANEILFREEMTITALGDILDEVRQNLTERNLDLPVATSDLGDDWTPALSAQSDYVMSNIHPFFAGVAADKAAAWTINFFEVQNADVLKSDKKKNIISETGWPTGGGKNCGGSTTCGSSTPGSVAGIDELNTFMEDWVCPALNNGTNYFWFSAFDEPWKAAFNEPGKEWEDKWGLMDVNRDLKPGVEIPDCGGKTIS